MGCGTITLGSGNDCDNEVIQGTEARLILLNFDDVESYAILNGKITAITLKTGKKAYQFLGFRNDVKKSEEVFKGGNLKSRFKHHLSFVIYERDQIQKINVIKLAKGRFVAIVESKGKTDDSIELLGKEVGLSIVQGQIRDAYDNGGLFVLNMSTPDNGQELERKLPQTVGNSYENGLEIIGEVADFGIFDTTFDQTFN